MSNSDNVIRLPRIAQSVRITESDDMGGYSYTVPQNVKRLVVAYDRAQKREMAQSGSGRKAQIVDLDTQEQMREALLSAPYTGPVGTPKAANDYRTAFDSTFTACMDMCCRMPSREEVGSPNLQRVARLRKVEPVVSRNVVLDSGVDRSREYSLRDIGFGGRYGVHLEG